MRDPVCGMNVESEKAAGSAEWQGETYFFCSDHCREEFVVDPEAALRKRREKDREKEQAETASGKEYTCPMHPEVVQQGPGSCPICGMDLEPKQISAEEEENPELVAMTRRFWVSLALAVPVLFLAMSDLIPGEPVQHWLGVRTITWIELVLATPVVLWGGSIFFRRAWASLVNRNLNMFTLIGLGTGVAYLYSLIAALFPEIFPTGLPRPRGQRRRLFRGGRGHRHPGAPRADARAAGPQPDRRRHPLPARAGPQDRPPAQRGRQRGGCAAGEGAGRRPAAHPPRGEGAGGRRGARREQRCR